jgi:DNA-binding NarL/FixJ family response regulator
MRTKKPSPVARIRILLIEDNRLLRDGIAAMLNKHGDFDVVARSEDGDSVRQFKNMKKDPDVILLDLGLEKEDSLKLMSLLREESSEVKVIAMDILPDHVDIIEFVKAGGAGFILKNAPFEDWIKTIKTVAAGQKVLPPCLAQSLFAQIIEVNLKSGKGIPVKSIRFTSREREIVDLISEGLSNKGIAERLHIATFTAKSHVHNILEKMALSTRLQIAASVRKDESE